MALFDESSYSFSLTDGRLCQAFTRRSHLSAFVGTSGSDEADSIPLFVNDVWPGCKALANFIDINRVDFEKKSVIEFGAGCALPSCVAAMVGASNVVVTDYPGAHVLETIELVMSKNQLLPGNVSVLGHEWGSDVLALLACNSDTKFDAVLIAEPFWRDTKQYHSRLLQSIAAVLTKEGQCYIAFCHRPCEGHTIEDDLHFFVMAQQDSFDVEKKEVITGTYHDVDEYSNYVDVQLYVLSRQT
jgi:EEF1A N-terminal glycine/lysine methyltransferase